MFSKKNLFILAICTISIMSSQASPLQGETLDSEDVDDSLTTGTGRSILECLPYDVLRSIISYTTPGPRTSLAETCRTFNVLCEEYSYQNPFAFHKNIDMNLQGFYTTKAVGDRYWIYGSPTNNQGQDHIITIEGCSLESHIIENVTFEFHQFLKGIACANGMLLPNVDGHIQSVTIQDNGTLEIQTLFPEVDSINFGVLAECNGNLMAISEWEEELNQGAILLLESSTNSSTPLHVAGVDPEKPFISVGNNWYFTREYVDNFVFVNPTTKGVFLKAIPETLNPQLRTGNNSGRIVLQSNDVIAGKPSYSYHLGIFDEESIEFTINPLGFSPLPETYKTSNFFLYNNLLITVGYAETNQPDALSSIMTINNVDTDEHVYTYKFLENSRYRPTQMSLVGKNLFVFSKSVNDERYLSVLNLKYFL